MQVRTAAADVVPSEVMVGHCRWDVELELS